MLGCQCFGNLLFNKFNMHILSVGTASFWFKIKRLVSSLTCSPNMLCSIVFLFWEFSRIDYLPPVNGYDMHYVIVTISLIKIYGSSLLGNYLVWLKLYNKFWAWIHTLVEALYFYSLATLFRVWIVLIAEAWNSFALVICRAVKHLQYQNIWNNASIFAFNFSIYKSHIRMSEILLLQSILGESFVQNTSHTRNEYHIGAALFQTSLI